MSNFLSFSPRNKAVIVVLRPKLIFEHVMKTKEIVMKYKYLKTGTLIPGLGYLQFTNKPSCRGRLSLYVQTALIKKNDGFTLAIKWLLSSKDKLTLV